MPYDRIHGADHDAGRASDLERRLDRHRRRRGRARAAVRAQRRAPGNGQLPPGAAHLTRAIASLRTLRGLVGSAPARFEAASSDERTLESIDFQTAMNLLKVNASELAIATVMSALQASGLSGYRNDSDFSVGRHLRDVLSSPIMINNDRILANVGDGVPAERRSGVAARTLSASDDEPAGAIMRSTSVAGVRQNNASHMSRDR